MKPMSNDTEARIVYGKKRNPPMKYAWTWEAFERTDEQGFVPLTDEEQLKVRNDQIEGKARSAAFTAAAEAAGYEKPTAENDGLVRLKDAYKMYRTVKLKDGTTPKYTHEQARAKAEEATELSWSDFEE